MKHTIHFLPEIKSLGQLPEWSILCTIYVLGLCQNIPHEKGLAWLRTLLDARTEKKLTTETFLVFAEIILKSNIFQFHEETLKQLRGTVIGTKLAPTYGIVFMVGLEEKILEAIELQPRKWWRYIDDIFFICLETWRRFFDAIYWNT